MRACTGFPDPAESSVLASSLKWRNAHTPISPRTSLSHTGPPTRSSRRRRAGRHRRRRANSLARGTSPLARHPEQHARVSALGFTTGISRTMGSRTSLRTKSSTRARYTRQASIYSRLSSSWIHILSSWSTYARAHLGREMHYQRRVVSNPSSARTGLRSIST